MRNTPKIHSLIMFSPQGHFGWDFMWSRALFDKIQYPTEDVIPVVLCSHLLLNDLHQLNPRFEDKSLNRYRIEFDTRYRQLLVNVF